MSVALSRISGRAGQVIDLNVTFYRNGIPTDPFAVRRVDIYHTQVLPHNLIATAAIAAPTDPTYPAPLEHGTIPDLGPAGTIPQPNVSSPGEYHLYYQIPLDFPVPDVYFDVWNFFADNPCGELGTGGDPSCGIDNPAYANFLLSQCQRFWLYPDQTITETGLETVNFGFEPLNLKFNQPEKRPLEVGIMPLPLYDYDFNLVQPLIPQLVATISIETQSRELLVARAPMTIGLRMGSYRSNPYTLKYHLDTTAFLKGTYQYHVTVTLPDGSTRTSGHFVLCIG